MLYLYILKCQHLFLGFSSFTIPIPDRLKGQYNLLMEFKCMYLHVCNIFVLYVCINACMGALPLFFDRRNWSKVVMNLNRIPLYHTSVMRTCVFLIFEPPQLSPQLVGHPKGLVVGLCQLFSPHPIQKVLKIEFPVLKKGSLSACSSPLLIVLCYLCYYLVRKGVKPHRALLVVSVCQQLQLFCLHPLGVHHLPRCTPYLLLYPLVLLFEPIFITSDVSPLPIAPLHSSSES